MSTKKKAQSMPARALQPARSQPPQSPAPLQSNREEEEEEKSKVGKSEARNLETNAGDFPFQKRRLSVVERPRCEIVDAESRIVTFPLASGVGRRANGAGVVTAEEADAVDEIATEDDAVISHGFPLRKLQTALDGDVKPGGIIAASTAAAATTAAAAASPIAASTHGMSRDVE